MVESRNGKNINTLNDSVFLTLSSNYPVTQVQQEKAVWWASIRQLLRHWLVFGELLLLFVRG